MLCPACSGGSTAEKSLSISRLTSGLGIWAKCWRASCGFKSFIGYDKVTRDTGIATPKKAPHKVFKGDISELSADTEELILAKYEIPPETLFEYGVGWCYEYNRMYLPCRDFVGALRGCSLRSLVDGVKPKTFTYREDSLPDTVPLVSYFGNREFHNGVIFIVEGQLDAMKIASLGFNSVALIGCELNVQKAMDIRKYFARAVIFLDPDALDKAFEAKKAVGWLFDCLLVNVGKLDPKDTPREELRTILRNSVARAKDTGGVSERQEIL